MTGGPSPPKSAQARAVSARSSLCQQGLISRSYALNASAGGVLALPTPADNAPTVCVRRSSAERDEAQVELRPVGDVGQRQRPPGEERDGRCAVLERADRGSDLCAAADDPHEAEEGARLRERRSDAHLLARAVDRDRRLRGGR